MINGSLLIIGGSKAKKKKKKKKKNNRLTIEYVSTKQGQTIVTAGKVQQHHTTLPASQNLARNAAMWVEFYLRGT